MAGRPPGQPKTGGRQKGGVNKFTSSVKDAFAEAFTNMGGSQALLEWGKKNPTDFYKLASKLIPSDINAAVTSDLYVDIIKFSDVEKDLNVTDEK